MSPVYLLSAPFSGASVLAGMLGRHPALYAVPELNLFLANTVGGLLDIFDMGQGGHSHGLLRALAQLDHGGQHDEGIAAARAWLDARRSAGVAEVLQNLVERVAPKRLLVPDAESPLRPMDLQGLREARPRIECIHLLRHPWSQGVLLHAFSQDKLFVPQDYKDHSVRPPLLDPQICWLRAEHNLQALFGERPPLLHLCGEALDEDFDAAMRQLCEVLGISADASALAAMRTAEQWTFAGHGPRSAPYGLEPEALESFTATTLDLAAAASLSKPLPWRPDGAPFAPEVQARARACGYL
ncbi:MAG: sulfotransferase [Pseudomonadota bacterium]